MSSIQNASLSEPFRTRRGRDSSLIVWKAINKRTKQRIDWVLRIKGLYLNKLFVLDSGMVLDSTYKFLASPPHFISTSSLLLQNISKIEETTQQKHNTTSAYKTCRLSPNQFLNPTLTRVLERNSAQKPMFPIRALEINSAQRHSLKRWHPPSAAIALRSRTSLKNVPSLVEPESFPPFSQALGVQRLHKGDPLPWLFESTYSRITVTATFSLSIS